MDFLDAHNHLEDERLLPFLPAIWRELDQQPIRKLVVNGSCEEDWPDVLRLAKSDSRVLPSFGYHPWYVKDRTPRWKEELISYLDQIPSAIGEIGLDRWIENYDMKAQTEAFTWQLRLAAERNLPASIHCLKAWGLLLEILQREPRPACGFLLHSYGGPKEMIPEFVKLGGYFSFPGYFAHERKQRQRETFRHVPSDRFLIETNAPDQILPAHLNRFPLPDNLNHPANIAAIYQYLSNFLELDLPTLASQVQKNFHSLFGS